MDEAVEPVAGDTCTAVSRPGPQARGARVSIRPGAWRSLSAPGSPTSPTAVSTRSFVVTADSTAGMTEDVPRRVPRTDAMI